MSHVCHCSEANRSPEPSGTQNVQQRFGRDERAIMRHVNRDTDHFLARFDGNAEVSSKVKDLRTSFQQAIADIKKQVANGGLDYGAAAQKMVAARRAFQQSLRELGQNAQPPRQTVPASSAPGGQSIDKLV